MSRSKNYSTISQKERLAYGEYKKFTKDQNIFYFKILTYYIFSTCEALIHSIWIENEKVMDNLVFQAI